MWRIAAIAPGGGCGGRSTRCAASRRNDTPAPRSSAPHTWLDMLKKRRASG